MKFLVTFAILVCVLIVRANGDCNPSKTTTSGHLAPKKICAGDLIFSDEFDKLDLQTWQHENTLSGGRNWEFQWYTNNRTNSFTENGKLFLTPTLTADHLGEAALTSQTLDLNGGSPGDFCTDASSYGCSRTGNPQYILNPIKSARLRTLKSFNFRYGRLEIKAKMPTGDWLWPAIWLLPREIQYGFWPASGEIDILESRGNRDLAQNGRQIGNQNIASTLHWGPDVSQNRFSRTHWEKINPAGYDKEFHTYGLEWTPEHIKFILDGEEIGKVAPGNGGFWDLGNLANSGYANPWVRGSKMAPFDQEFYIIVNLAVGGISYFPDDATSPTQKPWNNKSPTAAKDFWSKRNEWLPTWNLNSLNREAALQVDYIKVYAV